MSLFYRIAYGVGVVPWEKAAEHPVAKAHIAALFDREQAERQRPLGKSLDVGCGTGHWSIDLASRGWEVTGVDIVGRAVRKARERAEKAGVPVRFIEGDILMLATTGVGSGFDFIWDFGTLHGFASEQLETAGREITAVASSGATMLILAWSPANRGPLPRGASRAQIESAFPAWQTVAEDDFDATGLPAPLRKVGPKVYRLRRG
jgi:SAM-dependent methyltransferase